MIYVTFVSHYGAIRFRKKMQERGVRAELRPVPRFLSSSCGTCAVLDDGVDPADLPREDVEGVYPRP